MPHSNRKIKQHVIPKAHAESGRGRDLMPMRHHESNRDRNLPHPVHGHALLHRQG